MLIFFYGVTDMTDIKIKQIQEFLCEGDAALISSDENRLYLTGFESSAGTLFITKETPYFIIDFRYIEVAKRSLPFLNVILQTQGNADLVTIAKDNGIKRVLVETDRMSIDTFAAYKETLGDMLSSCDCLTKHLTKIRAVKEDYELESIKEAQRLTDETFSYILERIEEGRTEREIMLEMEFYMRKLGSEGAAFDFIVVSGKNSSLPHGVPTDKKIEKGDFITMDYGAIVNGYRSDMTRTVAVGYASDEMKKVYETVAAAQNAAFEKIKAGVDCFSVDKAARDLIYGAGYEGCFGHGLGHSVGVEIHEYPNFNARCHHTLQKGNIMTVEPGIYLENKFGVRIEDMVYVTENGFINLTKSNKDLIIL